jgi:hypothetical protein
MPADHEIGTVPAPTLVEEKAGRREHSHQDAAARRELVGDVERELAPKKRRTRG